MWPIKKSERFSLLLSLAIVFVSLFTASVRTEAWEYTVQRGDTLLSVTEMAQCSVYELTAVNAAMQEDKENYIKNAGQGEDLSASWQKNFQLRENEIINIPDYISSTSVFTVEVVDLTLPVSEEPVIAYSESELNLLARCIYAEAGAEDYEGQVAVGAVVVNRVKSDVFPDNIRDVIYQKKQFSCVDNGAIKNDSDSSESCYQAALAALYGADNTFGALYFWAPDLVYSKYHESLRYICTIGCHIFATDVGLEEE